MSLLGMYVHQHWSYRHPYAARTWRVEDWRQYAAGLAALGYNAVMIWPVTETMPDPLTPSDVAHLETMRQVIDLLHDEFGMTVLITMAPNVMGNARAAEYAFTERPYFNSDQRLDPADPAQVERLLTFRTGLLRWLGRVDGCAIIDSDPGGYAGSTNAEFADLLLRHQAIFRAYNPDVRLYYWMWVGWETYNRFWAATQQGVSDPEWHYSTEDCTAAVQELLARADGPWSVFSAYDAHHQVVDAAGIADRAVFFPYGAIELEPSFPLTNTDPASVAAHFITYDPQRLQQGVMGNAQTHVVQPLHTYYFAHFARGGTLETLDVAGFADGLLPGHGSHIAEAWAALASRDAARIRAAAEMLAGYSAHALESGPYAGLLLGDPGRFIADLVMQLRFCADALTFRADVMETRDWRHALRAVYESWGAWSTRTGFVDAYYGPVADLLHAPLRQLNHPAINTVFADFGNWRNPVVRHGIVTRLLSAMQEVGNE